MKKPLTQAQVNQRIKVLEDKLGLTAERDALGLAMGTRTVMSVGVVHTAHSLTLGAPVIAPLGAKAASTAPKAARAKSQLPREAKAALDRAMGLATGEPSIKNEPYRLVLGG